MGYWDLQGYDQELNIKTQLTSTRYEGDLTFVIDGATENGCVQCHVFAQTFALRDERHTCHKDVVNLVDRLEGLNEHINKMKDFHRNFQKISSSKSS